MDEQKQTTEVRDTNANVGDTNVSRQTVSTKTAVPGNVVAKRIVWYIVGVIVIFLALRILLLLLAANQGNGFVDFVYGVGGFFATPFYGIFSYQPSYGSSTFEISSVVAILVYTLVGWGVTKLFTLGSGRDEV